MLDSISCMEYLGKSWSSYACKNLSALQENQKSVSHHKFLLKNKPDFSLVWGNCAINPILYSFLGYGFKQKLKNAWNKIANNFKCCGGRFRYRTSSGINVSVSSREGSKATFTSYLPNDQTKKFLISGKSQNMESQMLCWWQKFDLNCRQHGKIVILTFKRLRFNA